MAPLTPTNTHSPYGTPVIPIDFMSEATRQYYTTTTSSRSRTPSVIGSDGGAEQTTTNTTTTPLVSAARTAATTPVHPSNSPLTHHATPSSAGSSPRRSFLWYQHPSTTSSTVPSYIAASNPPRVSSALVQAKMMAARPTIHIPQPHDSHDNTNEESPRFVPTPTPPALLLAQKGAQRLSDANYVSAFRPDWQSHRGVGTAAEGAPFNLSGDAAPTGGALRAVAHGDLMGKMTFFPYPATIDWASSLNSNDNRAGLACLFLGQIRFEANDREVAWIVQQTSGVVPMHVEIRARGCWLVYVATAEEAGRVLDTGRRILYDHSGIWFAADDAQHVALQAYLSSPRRRSVARLPRDTVIVEPAVPGGHRRATQPHAIIPAPRDHQE